VHTDFWEEMGHLPLFSFMETCASKRFQIFWFLRKPFFKSSRIRSKSALFCKLFQAGIF